MAGRVGRRAWAGGAPVASEVVRLERHGGGSSWRRSDGEGGGPCAGVGGRRGHSGDNESVDADVRVLIYIYIYIYIYIGKR
jgi:hypothetical protein